MENQLIVINSQKGLGSAEAKLQLKTDLLEDNLMVIGDLGSGKTVAVKITIEHLLQNGRNILHVDTIGELGKFTELVGGQSIHAKDFTFGAATPGITNITFSSRYEESFHSELNEFLNRMINDSETMTGYHYIVIDGEFSLLDQELDRFMEWVAKANARNIHFIITTIEVRRVLEQYEGHLIQSFPNVLVFRSRYFTDPNLREALQSGEAFVVRKGNNTPVKIRIELSPEEFQKFAAI